MARQERRVRPGDAANIFVRCLLSEAGQILGGLSAAERRATLSDFEHREAYTGQPLDGETLVKDHAIPMNQEHCGLHLYGNVLPTTGKVNAAKHHVHFRGFVREAEGRARIEDS